MHSSTHLGGIARHPTFEIEIFDHGFNQGAVIGLSLSVKPGAACQQKGKEQVFHDKYLSNKERKNKDGLLGEKRHRVTKPQL
jgi:hypothetical protein